MGFAQIFSVMLVSSVKFLFAPSIALRMEFSFWETIIWTSLGGIIGVTFFYFFASWIIGLIDRFRNRRVERRISQGKPVKQKKVFTPTKRRLIRIKHRFGLWGVAIVTPCIISIPVGATLAAKFYPNKWRTLPALYTTVLSWSLILTSFDGLVVRILETLF